MNEDIRGIACGVCQQQKDKGIERELDATIAEKIFNWEWWRSSSTGRRCLFAPGAIPRFPDEWFLERADGSECVVCDWPPRELPHYSTNIADAWQVVEKLRHAWTIELRAAHYLDEYVCEMYQIDEIGSECNQIRILATTMPRAICEAALKAIKCLKSEVCR